MTSPAAMLPSELTTPVTIALQTGDWSALQQLMDTGRLTEQQKVRVIVEVSKCANAQQLLQHISPYCSSGQFSSVMAQLVSAGCWTEVCKLSQCLGDRQPEWQIDSLSISSPLLSIVATGRWRELGAVQQEECVFSPAQKRWALLQACQRATQLEIINYVLPHCAHKDVDSVLQELVSRGLWWAVGSLFGRSGVISETQRRQALDKAAKEATTWEMSDFILPHCTKDELLSVSKLLLTRQLWWAFEDVLKKNESMFVECLLHACGNESGLFMNHLLNEGHLTRAQKLLQITTGQKGDWKLAEDTFTFKLIELARKRQWDRFAGMTGLVKNPAVIAWAMEEVSKKAERKDIRGITRTCPISQIPFVFPNLIKRGFMTEAASLLHRMVEEMFDGVSYHIHPGRWERHLNVGSVEEGLTDVTGSMSSYKEAFRSLLRMRFSLKEVYKLYSEIFNVKNTNDIEESHLHLPRSSYSYRSSADKLLRRVFVNSALDITGLLLCDQLNDSILPQSVDHQVHSTITEILKKIKRLHNDVYQNNIRLLSAGLRSKAREDHAVHPMFAISFILAVMKYCRGLESDHSGYFLAYLTTTPVVPEIQRNALRILLKVEEWDILQCSDLSCAGESVRRLLFSSAVKQRQWTLVKQWTDHNLQEDQRSWAMEIACEEEQWDVYRHLAEQGLSEDELIHAHYHIVLNADRYFILDMYKQETDVVEVKELLMKSKLPVPKPPTIKDLVFEGKVFQLSKLEVELKSKMNKNSLESAVEEGDWQVVVFILRQEPTADKVNMAVKAAAAAQAWRAVMQLLRLGVEVFDPRSFFLDMMDKGQWGVCRLMMEQGLSTELLMDVLPQLMELKQWGLVVKVMDCEVDDAVRLQVMNWALHSNEGSVVSKCMLGMKQGLSIQDREALFHRAIIQHVWQALLPLVKEQDDTGLQHRDTAVLHAIRELQWDVLDVCLRHHANINVLDANGEIPIHIAAEAGDWFTVLAFAKRGGDLSLLDSEGLSVLHRAIKEQQWKTVKSLIGFGGHLQECAKNYPNKTALEMLTNAHQMDIITDALFQKKGQWKGTNNKEETAIHMICVCGHHELIPFLLLQGVDPLSVARRGHSALSYAVLAKSAPQLTVAKCISLGFSAHQPHITHTMQQGQELFLSPVLLAVMRGSPVLTRMLYESGSCSSQELFHILPHLHELIDSRFLKRTTLGNYFNRERHYFPDIVEYTDFLLKKKLIQRSAQYLITASTTPRSLQSTCRLVISHSLEISGTREENIAQLPIPEGMKDYLLFSDLVGQECEQLEFHENLENSEGEEESSVVWYETMSEDSSDDNFWHPAYYDSDNDYNDDVYGYWADSSDEYPWYHDSD